MMADPGGCPQRMPPTPPCGPIFAQFHAVFQKNYMLAPTAGGLTPLPMQILDPPLENFGVSQSPAN